MVKTYILDTNILLSDSNALFSFGDNNIILPFIVIEELDRHKDRQDEVGRNAREIARKLSELTKENKNISQGISLGNNLGILKILSSLDVKNENVEIPSELEDIKNGDNTIVKFCLNYLNKNPNEKIILVTRDILLQLKATSLNIIVEDYKKYRVAENTNSLFSGVKTILDINVSDFYKNEESFRLPEDISRDLFPNQFLILKDQSDKSAIVRFLSSAKPLKLIQKRNANKFYPRNKEQEFAMDLLMDPEIKLVTLVGKAGSGKTLCSLAAGLEQVLGNSSLKTHKNNLYKNLVICRPIQPLGRDIGFLPGEISEKLEPWIAPIKDNLRFLITDGKKGKNDEQVLEYYFEQGIIEIQAMTFIRGRSIANAFMIIDEAQQLNAHELKTILTRVGENTKVVLTGDVEQIDSAFIDSVSNGLAIAVEKFKGHPIAGHVTLVKGERSPLATLSSEIL
jgi:PhoH-like ATPase